MKHIIKLACVVGYAITQAGPVSAASIATLDLIEHPEKQQLNATLDDRVLFTYNFGDEWALPHFYPLNTPSGRNLLVQKTDPYPHHRSFWVSDTVERDGVKGDIYNGYYSGVPTGNNQHKAPYNTAARHVRFDLTTSTGPMATIREELVWETSRTQTAYPLLNEHREIIIHGLNSGDYLMDFSFELKATYGDVKFISDAVHYAWPYLRINSTFNGENGGTITASNGETGQAATNMTASDTATSGIHWIDYSNTVDGVAEGVAIFQWPYEDAAGQPRKWLTREYGTFGPRRTDDKSGVPFTLKQGDSLKQRVGIYVHSGNVSTAKVKELYDLFTKGQMN